MNRTVPHLRAATPEHGILRYLDTLPVGPIYALAGVLLLGGWFMAPSEWRLMAMAFGACAFNSATVLLVWRRWRGAVAVFGLGFNYVLQAFFLGTMCIPALRGMLWFYEPYDILIGREPRVALMLTLVSIASLIALALRSFRTKPSAAAQVIHSATEIRHDPALPWLLVFSAAFSLLFWVGSVLEFGMVKAVVQTLQRTFMFVPFLAGFFFRVSPAATGVWLVTLALNLGLGILTGSRAPAFLPAVLYVAGVFFGCSNRQRLYFLLVTPAVAIPAAYVFGMIEVIRSSSGRLTISELSAGRFSEVSQGMSASGVGDSRDPYAELPAWVRTNARMVTWPTMVVAAAAGGANGYRGYDDLGVQIFASLNVVALTGTMSGYYNEGLFNLRASDYGFRVDTGTSVEFGLMAEAWDRGGPIGAGVYALIAVLILGGTEAFCRRLLKARPAFCAIAVSALFTTAYWTLNVYNLPLSFRHMLVNLIVCLGLLGAVSLFTRKWSGRPSLAPATPDERAHPVGSARFRRVV